MFPHSNIQRSRRFGLRAFTLVEVATALGITSFCLPGILGMLPLALTTFREAIDTTVSAQLAQRIVTDAEQSDFDLLIASAEKSDAQFFVLPERYFDEQGTEVQPDDPNAARKTVYHVRVRGSQPGPADTNAAGGSFTSLPGSERFRPRASAFLTVQVAWHPGLAPLPVDEARQLWKPQPTGLSTFRAVITRNGLFAAGTAPGQP
jgi:uncharacterized protein (TIGR02598 family)